MAFIKAFFFFSLEDCFFEEEEPAGETLEGAASISGVPQNHQQ
jgi:hypothetical protein